MTDRELLELAAKAAGLQFGGDEFYDENGPLVGWNPLTDDGDALRLAVKLHIDLDQYADRVHCCKSADFDDAEDTDSWESFNNDPYAATRRAIVRAAAEIGKSVK